MKQLDLEPREHSSNFELKPESRWLLVGALAIATVAALFSATVPASAQYVSGNDLHDSCQSNPSFASGYVLGVIDEQVRRIAAITLAGDASARVDFCIPPGVLSGQAVDIVCQSLTQSPADRHLFAPFLVVSALSQAWPCR